MEGIEGRDILLFGRMSPEVRSDDATTDDRGEFRAAIEGTVVPNRRRTRGRRKDGPADMTVDSITIDMHDVTYRSRRAPAIGLPGVIA